jgi:lipopolysaccharide export system protein LptC
MTLDTSQATYNKAEEIVTSTAPVKVVHEMMDITGERLKAELAAHRIVFSGGVTTLLKGKKKDVRS